MRYSRTRRARQRGSAITELVLLIFPYAMCVVGVIVLGHLAIGKQESQKLAFLAAPLPGDQSADSDFMRTFAFAGWNIGNPGSANATFMRGVNGVAAFRENTAFVPDATRANDEPVLPYTAEDIDAAFIRLSYTVTNNNTVSGGSVQSSVTRQTTATGQFLETYDIMSNGAANGIEGDAAGILGEWLDFSQAQTEYGFSFGGKDGGEVAFESAESGGLRHDLYELHRLKPGIDRDSEPEKEKGYAYYAASRNVEFWHGTAQNRDPWSTYSIFGTAWSGTPERVLADMDFNRLDPVAGSGIAPSQAAGGHVMDDALLYELSDIMFTQR